MQQTVHHYSQASKITTQSRRLLLLAPLLSCTTAPLVASAAPLAPLGAIKSLGEKQTGLSADQIRDILAKDIGVEEYFVTGNLTKSIFADDCRFRDPTNDVTGLSRYLAALKILFDPKFSGVRLVSIKTIDARTIYAEWELGGYLRHEFFFWNPRVEKFRGTATYTLNDDGLIVLQDETWDVSPFEALRETFTPTFAPPTKVL